MPTIEQLIDLALEEDIGPGDVTTESLIDKDAQGEARIIAKEPLVLAGCGVAQGVFKRLDPKVRFLDAACDGDRLSAGDRVLKISGSLRALLCAERTALNFLQHLSGIATWVRSFTDLLDRRPVRLVDTRKTTPGLRILEKYAVRVGGAQNHRLGLYDGILVKDNHIAAFGSITAAVARLRQNAHHLLKIEVEVTNLKQVEEALQAGADVIMLDNMDIGQIKKAVARIKGKALCEVSGGIKRDNIVALAETGVDIISVGALIHSAPSVDISMDIEG